MTAPLLANAPKWNPHLRHIWSIAVTEDDQVICATFEPLSPVSGPVPVLCLLPTLRYLIKVSATQIEMEQRCIGHHPSPSSLASTPFTARAQPASLRSRVAVLIAGLKRRSSRQLSANFSGAG